MSKIVFLKNPFEVYDADFSQIGQHQIKLVFETEIPDDDILLSGLQLINEYNGIVQTRREDYRYVYRRFDNPLTIALCNDGIEYVEPEPVVVPEPEPYVPTPAEMEALFQQNKREKIALSKSMLADFLENNPIHSSVHNDIEGIYSVTYEKQMLMTNQYMTYQIEKAVNPNAKLRWNETGKSCEDWSEDEFLQLVLEIKSYVYPLISYQQHLEEDICKCVTQEELDKIVIDYSCIK